METLSLTPKRHTQSTQYPARRELLIWDLNVESDFSLCTEGNNWEKQLSVAGPCLSLATCDNYCKKSSTFSLLQYLTGNERCLQRIVAYCWYDNGSFANVKLLLSSVEVLKSWEKHSKISLQIFWLVCLSQPQGISTENSKKNIWDIWLQNLILGWGP